jgi:hypothetical protein
VASAGQRAGIDAEMAALTANAYSEANQIRDVSRLPDKEVTDDLVSRRKRFEESRRGGRLRIGDWQPLIRSIGRLERALGSEEE